MRPTGARLSLPLLLLSACTVGPNYAGPPPTGTADRFVRAPAAAATQPVVARWWEALGDPTLTMLVDAALSGSPTIDVALARVREAQAQLRQQRTADLPSASANATTIQARLPGIAVESEEATGGSGSNLDFYNLGLNASWEIDLFGGGRRGLEQARATLGARAADLADAQVTLSAQVAQAYVGLRDVQARMRLNAQTVTLQERQVALLRQRLAAGASSALDVERSRGQLETTQGQAIPLAAERDGFLNQLAVMTGRAPGALDATLAAVAPVPLPPAQVAIGDPARLIAQRPDVRAAERELAAGTAAIGVARAKELPGIRFLGLLGLGGTSPGDVFALGQLTTLAAPSLSWSFLDFGRTRAATRVSEARREQAEARYREAVLRALEDAETALSRFANARLRLGQAARAEATATRSATLNRQRFDAGTATLIDQLDVERQRVAASMTVAQSRAHLADSYIAVNKALGLGWRPGP